MLKITDYFKISISYWDLEKQKQKSTAQENQARRWRSDADQGWEDGLHLLI